MSAIKHSTTGGYLPVRRGSPRAACAVSPCWDECLNLAEESVPLGATEAPSCGTVRSVPRAVTVRWSL